MKRMTTILIGICAIGALATAAPFGTAPDWESNDNESSIKVILADFNGDGWQTEIGEQKTGDGTAKCFYLEQYPAREIIEIRVDGTPLTINEYCCDVERGWFSLAIAPGNSVTVEVDYVWSNRLDMFVSNEPMTASDGYDRIYFNNGSGLNADAGWQADYDDLSDYCAAGDIDLDGDIDLIVHGWLDDLGVDFAICIFYNDGNGLETTPSHIIDIHQLMGFALGDIDADGYPELAYSYFNGSEEAYFGVIDNVNGTFNSTPMWGVDYNQPWSVAWGDYDGDGDLDLAAGTLYSLYWQGEGRAYVFRNNNGILGHKPCWQNGDVEGYSISVSWGDFDGDGLLDLFEGAGAGSGCDNSPDIFFNQGDGLQSLPGWSSQWINSSVHTVSIADYDFDGLNDAVTTNLSVNGYFHTTRNSLEENPSWHYNPEGYSQGGAVGDLNNDGWFDIALAHAGYSADPTGQPNLVFYNDGSGVGFDDDGNDPVNPTAYALYQSYPNPMRSSADIAFVIPHTSHISLEVFDLKGRKVSTLVDGSLNKGEHQRTVSGLSAGIYLYRLQADEFSAVKKIVVK